MRGGRPKPSSRLSLRACFPFTPVSPKKPEDTKVSSFARVEMNKVVALLLHNSPSTFVFQVRKAKQSLLSHNQDA